MSRALITLPLVLALAGGLACARKGAHDHGEAEHEHGAEAGPLKLSDVRGLKLMTVPEAREEGRWMPGEAAGDEAAQALLSSPVKGLVRQLLAVPGQALRAGTPVALVQSPELARLKSEWLAARARLERTRADLAREERLAKAGAGARRELEAAQAEAATAAAEEASARLGLEAVGLKPGEAGALFTLRAPAAGAVLAWKVQRGQGVEAGQELGAFQAARADLVRLELGQPGPASWQVGSRAEVRDAAGHAWRARVEGLPVALTADTRRLSYRLRLEGGNRPIPGTPVEVKVPLGKGLFLPQGALQQVEGAWGVFVAEGERASFRPVTRGAELGDQVQVLGGVKPGERVVSEGAYLLKALTGKRLHPEEEGGHAH